MVIPVYQRSVVLQFFVCPAIFFEKVQKILASCFYAVNIFRELCFHSFYIFVKEGGSSQLRRLNIPTPKVCLLKSNPKSISLLIHLSGLQHLDLVHPFSKTMWIFLVMCLKTWFIEINNIYWQTHNATKRYYWELPKASSISSAAIVFSWIRIILSSTVDFPSRFMLPYQTISWSIIAKCSYVSSTVFI